MANRKDKQGRVLQRGESQRKDGRYCYRWTDATTHKEKCVYAKTLQELREKKLEVMQNISDGVDGKQGGKITLNDMIEKYLESKQGLKTNTKVGYYDTWRWHIKDTIGKKKVKDIRYSTVLDFYMLLANEKDLSMSSINAVHTVLHPTFRLAVRDNIIKSNPADSVLGDVKKATGKQPTKRHALTIQEQTDFMAFVKSSNRFNYLYPLFVTLLGTGCRIGEVIGLRWDDVDFSTNTISINHNTTYKRQMNGKHECHITTPKTKAGCRTIPMLSEVRKALHEQRKYQFMTGTDKDFQIDGYKNFIFTNSEGHLYLPNCINRAIARTVKRFNKQEEERAKKEQREPNLIRPFTCHHLRHTFATRFCENETNLKVIQEIMGHSDISITMNIYNEATMEKKQEAFENLDSKIKIC